MTTTITLTHAHGQVGSSIGNPSLFKPAITNKWEGLDHPISLDILADLKQKNIRLDLYRRGKRLGKFIDISPATAPPFYNITYMHAYTDDNGQSGSWVKSEVVIKGTVERLAIKKQAPNFFIINIPE